MRPEERLRALGFDDDAVAVLADHFTDSEARGTNFICHLASAFFTVGAYRNGADAPLCEGRCHSFELPQIAGAYRAVESTVEADERHEGGRFTGEIEHSVIERFDGQARGRHSRD